MGVFIKFIVKTLNAQFLSITREYTSSYIILKGLPPDCRGGGYWASGSHGRSQVSWGSRRSLVSGSRVSWGGGREGLKMQ